MDEREIFRKLMKKQMLEGTNRDLLMELKIRPTYGNGILFQMVKKAAEGDLTAAKYVLGAVQEEAAPEVGTDLRQISTRELLKLAGNGLEAGEMEDAGEGGERDG